MAYSARADKDKAIDEIKEKLAKTVSIVVADYRGMNVPAVTGLRDQFRKVSAEYKVYKNTLVKRAIAGTKMEPLGKFLEGTTAIMFSYESPSAAAKVATEFEGKQDKDKQHFKVKAAYFEGTLLEGKNVQQLASMPGKDELRATLLATFMAPAQSLVATLAAGPTNFVYLLDAYKRKQEGTESQG